MISRIRFEAYGPTAADVEKQLLEFGGKCDSATGASSCAYGEMVIERQLTEAYGSPFAFKGRQLLHPDIGEAPFIPPTIAQAHAGPSGSGDWNFTKG